MQPIRLGQECVLTGSELCRRGCLFDDTGGGELEEGCHEALQQPLHCPGAPLQPITDFAACSCARLSTKSGA